MMLQNYNNVSVLRCNLLSWNLFEVFELGIRLIFCRFSKIDASALMVLDF